MYAKGVPLPCSASRETVSAANWVRLSALQARPSGHSRGLRFSDGRVRIWHIWQTAPNNGWSGWASLGGNIPTLTARP